MEDNAPADEIFKLARFGGLFANLDSLTFTAITGQGLSGDFALDNLDVTVTDIYGIGPTQVPEPVTLSLFGAGVVGAIVMRRRKKVLAS